MGDLKRRVRVLRFAERVRQRKYERKRAMRSFFSDPSYGRSLLGLPKSGKLSVEQDKLEEHLLKTYTDVLRHESLQERLDILAIPSACKSLLLGVFFARGGERSCEE